MQDIIVEHNKSVIIKSIHQWMTYGGLLEGLPTDRMNKNILERLPDQIKQHCGDWPFYILEPIQTPIEFDDNYIFGKPMKLPSVICIIDLTFHKAVRNPQMHGSSLIIAWFQNSYAFPIEDEIIEKFKKLAWSQYARDFEY